MDIFIAATAYTYNASLYTLNIKDFAIFSDLINII